MCDDHLVCPSCGSLLQAVCNIAGDNAAGFYVEFFLLESDTDVGGLVAEPTRKGAFTAGRVAPPAAPTVGATSSVSAGALQFPTERGFDDDEAPWPVPPASKVDARR